MGTYYVKFYSLLVDFCDEVSQSQDLLLGEFLDHVQTYYDVVYGTQAGIRGTMGNAAQTTRIHHLDSSSILIHRVLELRPHPLIINLITIDPKFLISLLNLNQPINHTSPILLHLIPLITSVPNITTLHITSQTSIQSIMHCSMILQEGDTVRESIFQSLGALRQGCLYRISYRLGFLERKYRNPCPANGLICGLLCFGSGRIFIGIFCRVSAFSQPCPCLQLLYIEKPKTYDHPNQYTLISQCLQKMIPQPNPNQILTGLEQADYSKALEHRTATCNRYYKDQQVSWFPELSHFKIYGVGTYLFFAFIKHATVLFLILTVISVAPIALNVVKGVTFRNSENSLSVFLTRTSLGSHKYSIMSGTNAYTESITYKIVNVTFDLVNCFIFLVFCLYWQRKSKTIEKHISNEIKLQSKFTVEVVEFPPDLKQLQMEEFMGRFGTVREIVAARDYTEEITISKEICQKEEKIKQLQFEDRQTNSQEITKLISQLTSHYQSLSNLSGRTHQTIKYYIQYSTPEQRKEVLSKFQPYQRLCHCQCCSPVPEELLYGGEQMKVVACNTEPIGVLWENAHFSWRNRLPRYILQVFIVLFIIFAGFFLISFLNILIPPIDSDMDISNTSFDQVKTSNNTSLIKAWCIQNYEFNNPASPYFSTCDTYWKMYTSGTIISISISIIVMILCEIIKKIVYALAGFQRYTTRAEESVTVMTNLFIMDFLTTTLITFLMQANIFSLSIMALYSRIITDNDLKNNIVSMTEYSDLTPRWYKDIGYQIWFNIFIMIFLPQLTQPLAYYLKQKLSQCWAKRQKIQRKMNSILQPPSFQVQDLYANLLLIIATAIIFGGGIPLMMAVVTVCFFIKYFYYKFIFVRFCRVPIQFNQILNERVILIMKIILVWRFMISLYMYGADDVFAMEKSTFMKWASELGVPVFSSIFIIFSRILLTWYYSIFALIFILIMIFKQLIFRGVKKFKKYRRSKNQQAGTTINPLNPTQNNQPENPSNVNLNLKTKPNFPSVPSVPSNDEQSSFESWLSNEDQQAKSQREALTSYKIEKNPMYSQLMTIIILKLKKSLAREVSMEIPETSYKSKSNKK